MIITHLVALAIGALAMDYAWARRTGTDKIVFEAIRNKFKSWFRR